MKQKPPHERIMALAPGEAWTMIEDQPIREPDGRPAAVGDLVARWFGTDEPGRVFRIVRVHLPATYETVFEGFEDIEVSEAGQ